MKTKKQLEEQIQKARHQLEKIEAPHRHARNAMLIGKCFRFRNSYSSGESWWLYKRVTGAGDHWPECTSFEKTSGGTFEVRVEQVLTDTSRYQEITRKQYDAAWASFTAELLATHQ